MESGVSHPGVSRPGLERSVASPSPATARPAKIGPRRKRLGARPVFRIFQMLHRWFALVLGLLLLVIVVSGVALLYKGEIHRLAHPSLFHATDGPPVGFETARDAALRFDPKAELTGGQLVDGTYEFFVDGGKTFVVDAATGHVNGTWNTQKGVFGFLDNLHECGLTCEGYTGYVAGLNKPVGGILGDELTWGALVLGSIGLLLGFMVLTGLIVWWPGIRSMARGFKIRRKTNAYKLNYDLHKVVGAVALPFLAVWALTGAGFEFPFVGKLWYAVLPGEAPAEPAAYESKPTEGKPITMTQAVAAAGGALAGTKVVAVYSPDETDPKSAWSVWLATGNDPYDHGQYPGNVEARVDQYSGATSLGYGAPGTTDTVAESLWENWNYPIHAGTPINGWWRSLWLILGATPILLAVTGTATWWIRRGKAKRKKRMKAERAATAAAST